MSDKQPCCLLAGVYGVWDVVLGYGSGYGLWSTCIACWAPGPLVPRSPLTLHCPLSVVPRGANVAVLANRTCIACAAPLKPKANLKTKVGVEVEFWSRSRGPSQKACRLWQAMPLLAPPTCNRTNSKQVRILAKIMGSTWGIPWKR